jgi:hypothetical protein
MNKKRPNRMVKESRVERQEEEPMTTTKEAEKTETPQDADMPTYPCKFCQGETRVVRSFPATESAQAPVKVIKRRHRQCMVCRRQFSTQEETFK